MLLRRALSRTGMRHVRHPSHILLNKSDNSPMPLRILSNYAPVLHSTRSRVMLQISFILKTQTATCRVNALLDTGPLPPTRIFPHFGIRQNYGNWISQPFPTVIFKICPYYGRGQIFPVPL